MWDRLGMNEAELRRDETECASQAHVERLVPRVRVLSRRGVPDEGIELVPETRFDFDLYQRCMERRGYRQVPKTPQGSNGANRPEMRRLAGMTEAEAGVGSTEAETPAEWAALEQLATKGERTSGPGVEQIRRLRELAQRLAYPLRIVRL